MGFSSEPPVSWQDRRAIESDHNRYLQVSIYVHVAIARDNIATIADPVTILEATNVFLSV